MANIKDAHQILQDAWPEIKRLYAIAMPGKRLMVSEVYREPSRQMDLYKMGRTKAPNGDWVVTDKKLVVTYVDGYEIVGAHNHLPALAIDVIVVNNSNGAADWKEDSYSPLEKIAFGLGLESGISWSKFKDPQHIQIPNWKELCQ